MTNSSDLPSGTPITRAELVAEGFNQHHLAFRTSDYWSGVCEWDTDGTVPDSGGLYAFILHPGGDLLGNDLRAVYVGLTGHLWMVTKGTRPGGGPRGPQRYGRHKHAAPTRLRVNGLIADAKSQGFGVSHWVRPAPIPSGVDARVHLRPDEEELIVRWGLRREGWNVG